MVYSEMNQLKRYHCRGEPFVTTQAHFHDNPSGKEGGNPGKSSTMGKIFEGSQFYTSKAVQSTKRTWTDGVLHSTSDLDKAPPPRQQITSTAPMSSTYRGSKTGTFTVELPHSTITYKNPNMVPYAQLTWRSEYTSKYIDKKPYAGYSELSTRWQRPATTRW